MKISKIPSYIVYYSRHISEVGRKRVNIIHRYFTNMIWIIRNESKISEIEIETVNRCNGTCPFCPVNANEEQRKYAKMSDELFKKIIDELSESKYCGKISLFSNNEPFLDERIIEFHKYAYEKLPLARHCLYTNGTLLSLDKMLDIIPYLDYLHIDNYNDEHKVNDNLCEVYNYICSHQELKNRIVFDFRLKNEILSSRGGQAPNKTKAEKTNERCLLPYRMFVVRPDGKISLCCNDALGKYTLGDLNVQTVNEIWNSKKYKNIRRSMLLSGRRKLKLCSNCDTKTEPF